MTKPGKKSLAARFPELAAQWHETKNPGLSPHDVVPGSGKKVWWRCPVAADHVWANIIANRARKGQGCPFCANLKVSRTNSLAAVFPDIAAEWHPTLNGTLRPSDVVGGSGRAVWWLCPVNTTHEWIAPVYQRTGVRSGCPFCTHKRASPETCLATRRPELAAEWHPELNDTLTPEMVTERSRLQVWWLCPRDPRHVWKTSVEHRTRGRGCPSCSNKRVDATNSLATLQPRLAAEWHPTRNGDLTPADVVPGSNKHAWWLCPVADDHVWRTVIARRGVSETACPFCRHTLPSRGYNLATQFPTVAAQWHPTRNGSLRPEDVLPGSARKVWWRCESGHAWQASLCNRTRGRGCPRCRYRRGRPATTRKKRPRVWIPSDWS